MHMKSLYTTSAIALILIITSCKEEEPPPVPIEVSFSSVTAAVQLTSVTLGTAITLNRGTVSEGGFLFGEAPGLKLESSEKLKASSLKPVQVEKADLKAGTVYYARPYAIVEEETFIGEEASFTTVKPTYTALSPLVAGRGQRVTITGDFKNSTQSQVKLLVDNLEPSILSFSNTSLTFLVPETVSIGANVAISLTIASHNLSISEKITISRWSVLASIPSPNQFHGAVTSDINHNFLHENVAYHFTSSRVYVYTVSSESWAQNDALGTELARYPVYFKIGNKGYTGFFGTAKTLQQFDFTTKAWSSAGNFPGEVHNFYYGVASARGDKAYYGLGYTDPGSGIGTGKLDFWEFNSANGQWTQRKDFVGTTVGYGVAFTINEYVFVGIGKNADVSSSSAKVYAYHTIDDTWTEVADYPGPFNAYMKAFSIGTKGIVIVKNEIWVYDFPTNQWTLYPDRIPGQTTRTNPAVFVGSNFFMVGGGISDPEGYQSDFYKLYPF